MRLDARYMITITQRRDATRPVFRFPSTPVACNIHPGYVESVEVTGREIIAALRAARLHALVG